MAHRECRAEACIIFLWAIGYHLAWILGKLLAGSLAFVLPVGYMIALVLRCFFLGKASAVHLTAPKGLSGGRWLFLWPLGVFPLWNLTCTRSISWNLGEIVSLAVAAMAEEFFFRGAFLSLWRKVHPKTAVIVSAVLFAVYHLFSPGRSGLQLWCALAAGVCYGKATLRTGSIWPAVLAHLALNLTGTWETRESTSLWLLALLLLIWGIWGMNERKKDTICDYT